MLSCPICLAVSVFGGVVRRGPGVVVLSHMPCCVSVRWLGGWSGGGQVLSCPPCLAVSVLGGVVRRGSGVVLSPHALLCQCLMGWSEGGQILLSCPPCLVVSVLGGQSPVGWSGTVPA